METVDSNLDRKIMRALRGICKSAQLANKLPSLLCDPCKSTNDSGISIVVSEFDACRAVADGAEKDCDRHSTARRLAAR